MKSKSLQLLELIAEFKDAARSHADGSSVRVDHGVLRLETSTGAVLAERALPATADQDRLADLVRLSLR